MNKAIIDAIEKAIDNFNKNMDFELKTSAADESTKYLVEQLSRQTFYAFNEISDQLKKL